MGKEQLGAGRGAKGVVFGDAGPQNTSRVSLAQAGGQERPSGGALYHLHQDLGGQTAEEQERTETYIWVGMHLTPSTGTGKTLVIWDSNTVANVA